MGSTTRRASHEDSASRPKGAMRDTAGAGPDREIRLRRIKKRLVVEAILRLVLMGLFLLVVSLTMGAALARSFSRARLRIVSTACALLP
jgi:hypothetical protein